MMGTMPRSRSPAAPDVHRIVGLLMARMADFPTSSMPAEIHNGGLTPDGEKLSEMAAAVSVGSLAAFVDSLLYCAERRIAPPLWMPAAAIEFATNWHPAIDYSPIGRTANPLLWQRRMLIKRARYEAVSHLLRLRADLRKFPDGAVADYLTSRGASHAEVCAALEAQRVVDPIIPAPKEETFEVAARMLATTQAAGSPDVVRKDYQRVRAARSRGEFPAYYWPSDETLELLGYHDLVGADRVPAPTWADEVEYLRERGRKSQVFGGPQLLKGKRERN